MLPSCKVKFYHCYFLLCQTKSGARRGSGRCLRSGRNRGSRDWFGLCGCGRRGCSGWGARRWSRRRSACILLQLCQPLQTNLTIKVECLLNIHILEVHTRSASSCGVGPLSLMIEVRMSRHVAVSMFYSTLLPKSNPLFRLFSSTPVCEAGYKMKSHSGARKRWRSLASGSSFKRVR